MSIKCQDCEATHADNRFAKIKAHDAGWFTTMDGRSWCPKHTPKWAKKWRKAKTDQPVRTVDILYTPRRKNRKSP